MAVVRFIVAAVFLIALSIAALIWLGFVAHGAYNWLAVGWDLAPDG